MPIPQQYLDANRFTDSFEWREPIKTQVGSGGEISVQNLETGKWEPARVVWQFDPTVGYNKQILLPDSVAQKFAPDAEWASQRSGTSGLVDKAGDFMNDNGLSVVLAAAGLNGMPMPWASGGSASGGALDSIPGMTQAPAQIVDAMGQFNPTTGLMPDVGGALTATPEAGGSMDWFSNLDFDGGALASDPSWGSSWAGSIDNPGLFDPSTLGFQEFGSGALASDPSWGESWVGSSDNPGAFNPSTEGFQELQLNDPGWGKSWRGSIDNPGLFDPSTPGFQEFVGPGLWETIKNLPSGAAKMATGLLTKFANGDTGALGDLAKLGIPAALLAGLFEKNKGPLDEALTQAGGAAVKHAGAFADMPGLEQTDAQRRAIELGKSNVGAWKPYIDKADTLTGDFSKGVAGVDLNKYMNPYLDAVLKNSIRDIEESAAKRNQQLRAITSKSGNDFRSSVDGGNRFNVEDSLLDRERLRAVGDTSAKVRAGAFDTAWTNAGRDVDRMGTAANTYGALGKTVGALGDSDVSSLTSAGALEQQPQKDALSKAAANVDVYRSIIPGTSQAATATKDPSKLSEIVGALGAYTTANKIGII